MRFLSNLEVTFVDEVLFEVVQPMGVGSEVREVDLQVGVGDVGDEIDFQHRVGRAVAEEPVRVFRVGVTHA